MIAIRQIARTRSFAGPGIGLAALAWFACTLAQAQPASQNIPTGQQTHGGGRQRSNHQSLRHQP